MRYEDMEKKLAEMDEKRKRHWEQYETDPDYKAKYDAQATSFQEAQDEWDEQERQARNNAGRYTIDEAAKFISDNSASIYDSILTKLKASANKGELLFYQPHCLEPWDKRTAVLGWYEECYWDDLNNWLANNTPRLGCSFPKPKVVGSNNKNSEDQKPWEIHDPRDPQPNQPWYTPARYFARQLVEGDSTLLTKRDILVNKVAQSLDKAGIKKRGGIKPFNPATIKKALTNMTLG